MLDLSIEFENQVQIPLSRYPANSYAINITNLPVESKRIKPISITITHIDPHNRPQIQFLFDSTSKQYFQTVYKFRLDFYTFKPNCLSIKSKIANQNMLTNLSGHLKPTRLAISKLFEIQFDERFASHTESTADKAADQTNEDNQYTYNLIQVTSENLTVSDLMVNTMGGHTQNADTFSTLKLILYLLISLFLIISIVFFTSLALVNSKKIKPSKYKNRLLFNNTDLFMPADANLQRKNQNDHSLSSSTHLIAERTATSLTTTTTYLNSPRTMKKTMRNNFVRKMRDNAHSLTNEVIANSEFDFVLMTNERRFLTRHYANTNSNASTIKVHVDYDNASVMASSSQQRTTSLTRPIIIKDEFHRNPPQMRTTNRPSRTGFNRWSAPHNILLQPGDQYTNFDGHRVADRRVSQIYEEMSNYFETLKESCA